MTAQIRELIRYATLAPSGHNTQPWRFIIKRDTVQIKPDYTRRLPVVDPIERELWISLGCAVENFIIAANSTGLQTEITYPSLEADFITLKIVPLRSLVPSSTIVSGKLLSAIAHRQNTRSLYEGRSVPISDMKQVDKVESEAGVSKLIFTDTAPKEAILEYIRQGDLRQFANPLFVDELVNWIRFNKSEALHSLDGLYSSCSGNPVVPRWLGKLFVTTKGGKQQSDKDAKTVRSSSGLIVINAEEDDKRHWIATGRLYERLALTLTELNIKTAFVNQPVEVTELRSQLQSYLNIGTSLPQLILRFGHAAPMPQSLRRPLEEVIV